MNLLVVRHAIAMDRVDYQLKVRSSATSSTATGDANDDFRPLTDEGLRKMKKNAEGLKTMVDRPSLLVSSPLTRAQQTAEILQAAWKGLEILTCEQLRPDAKPLALTNWLNAKVDALDGDPLVLIVGHEPQLTEVISWWLMGETKSILELKKGGACLIEFANRLQKSQGCLQWLATPKVLRGLK